MKCPKCGQDNPENATFCNHCGIVLNQKVQLSDIDKQRISEEKQERAKLLEQLQAAEKRKKGKLPKIPKWLWAFIVVLFVIFIVEVTIGIAKNSDSNTLHAALTTTTSNTTTTPITPTTTTTPKVYFNSSASETPEVIDVSYDDLSKLASTNEIAYDSEYKGRLLQLSNLRVVSVQSTANPRVNLVSAEGKSFTLYFNSTDGLDQLTPGMLLTVQGTSNGVYFGEPSFDENCVLVSAVE
jgi:hypothetical protein